MHQQNKNKHHTPVLAEQVINILMPKVGDSYLDLTAGYGGHAKSIMERTLAPSQAILVDRDQSACKYLAEHFDQVNIIHSDFLSASDRLLGKGRKFDVILADLGVSSPHLNTSSRGFSFKLDGPLDMRMDRSESLTAHQVVNSYSQARLEDIIRRYGEDKKAHKIADAIVKNRPIDSTERLASIVAQCWPGYHRIHPATRTFQAIRIEVNDELGQIERALPLWVGLLKPGGRLAVISFHSLEDRIVKQFFQMYAGNTYDSELILLTKKAVMGNDSEVASNPRARSAKLRAVAKINNKKGETHANTGKKPLQVL